MEEISLDGVVDMHVHTNPDLRRRRYDDFELCDAASRVGARAVVIKSHLGSTAERAFLANRYNRLAHGGNGLTIFGSITLNRGVGGINPAAVDNALRLGAKAVWLPTQSARRHLQMLGRPLDGAVDVVRDGKVVRELTEVFRLVKRYDAVLGTGHTGPAEIFPVVEAARKAGVEKIVADHPEWWVVGLSDAEQLRLAREYGVVLGRCFAQNMGDNTYKSNLQDNVRMVRAAGYEHVLVCTDGGQLENPAWEDAMRAYIRALADGGIPEAHIRYMTHELPCRLLGIEP